MTSSATIAELQAELGAAQARIAELEHSLHVMQGAPGERMEHALLEAVPDLVFRMDRQGVFRDYKADVRDLYIQSGSSIVGLSCRDTLPHAVADLVEGAITAALQTRRLQVFEYSLEIPGLGLREYEARMVPSGPDEVLTVVRDVTERKLIEQGLQASEEKYRALFEAAGDGIAIFDTAGHFVDANAQFCALLDRPRAEVVGAALSTAIVDATDELIARVRPILAREGRVTLEGELRRRDGSLVPIETTLTRMPGDLRLIVVRSTAERKRAETALRQSEEKFARLFHSSPVAMILSRKSTGEMLAVNEGFTALTGYSAEEAIGHTTIALGILTPEGRAEQMGRLQEGRLQNFEVEVNDRSGATKICLIALDTLELAGETCLLVSVLDITERKRSEVALRQSEELYHSLIESMESVIATVDAEGRYLYMNDVAAAMLGGKAEDLIGKTLFDVFPPPVAASQMASIRQVMHENRGAVYENPSMLGGVPHWFRTAIQPLHDDQGAVVGALINATSIHELKVAQQELQELNKTLEARVAERSAEVQDLYDNAPVGYHTVDANGCFTHVNQTALNWLGYTREELIGRPGSDILTAAGQATLAATLGELVQKGYLPDVEFEVIRKNGTTLPVLAHGLVIYDQDGHMHSVRTTLFDATERKRAEEATQRAVKEMARALQMRGEFLANMSHELRTPLSGILMLSEVLDAGIYGPLTDRQRDAIGKIADSGNHLLELINDVLDLSKLDAEQLQLEFQSVNVDETCAASLALVREFAHKKTIALRYSSPDPALVIEADGRRLKQMVVNLLSNAVKFTPEGGSVQLRVALDDERQELRITVQDSGIGIAAEDLPRLFQPFTQLDAGLARQHEGTGLGLALVRNLAVQHGGRAIAESAGRGQGSCFTIILPLRRGQRPEPAADRGQAGREAEMPPLQLRRKVLVAEDNEVNIDVLTTYFQTRGYVAVVARTGIEAVERAVAEKPDLILMDVQMPGLDGLEAIRRLRQDPAFAATPIIAVTALAMTGDRERCLAAGASDYLSKPLSLKALEAMMVDLLQAA